MPEQLPVLQQRLLKQGLCWRRAQSEPSKTYSCFTAASSYQAAATAALVAVAWRHAQPQQPLMPELLQILQQWLLQQLWLAKISKRTLKNLFLFCCCFSCLAAATVAVAAIAPDYSGCADDHDSTDA
jgi:hypothetical protein